MNRVCEWCDDDIPPRILAAFPRAIYCCTRCKKEGNAFGIYGDTRREKRNGKRFEAEVAAPAKPRTILRRAAI